MTTALNIDCMEYMKTCEDNAFELAIVDPPYGDAGGGGEWNRFGQRFDRYKTLHLRNQKEQQELSESAAAGRRNTQKNHNVGCCPRRRLFHRTFPHLTAPDYLGGNYFNLPPTRCFIVWEKLSISENFSMAMAEYAWTSFNGNAKIFKHAPQGSKDDARFHPTQKPVALYEWILANYAKEGDRIIDTHLGSGSSRIAAHKLGFDFVGCEIDKTYFDLQEERFQRETAQMTIQMFMKGETNEN